MSSPVIMWFRQDLRLADNAALRAAAAAGPVIPLYILDDDTPGDWRWGGASRWWLHKSIESLQSRIPLVLRQGRADMVITEVLRETGAGAVYFTRDYAPWSGSLERRIKAVCEAHGASCHRHGGFLLFEPESIRTGAGEPYKVYTPFSRACLALGDPPPPRSIPDVTWWTGKVISNVISDWGLLPRKPNWASGFESLWTPGEEGAKQLLREFLNNGLSGYAEGRDRPDLSHTSRLSPHLHWGEISPSQVWSATVAGMSIAVGKRDSDGQKFLKEVLWREFSYHLLHHFPHLPEAPFKPEFADFPWAHDTSEAFERWEKGLTGYPIVDAGMRELWATGYMHNRVRMITSSFLIKDLLIPWQEGEKWFWDTLVDADIANNAASWQWVAGCGADAAPYFRIFNPVLQGEKFDPHGAYVRQWVPEISHLSNDLIHRPWEAASLSEKTYPKPMIDHHHARDRALAALKSIKASSA